MLGLTISLLIFMDDYLKSYTNNNFLLADCVIFFLHMTHASQLNYFMI